MSNKTNAFGKDMQKKVAAACSEIFSGSTDDGNYKKLVYYRNGTDKSMFTYTIADLHDIFRFGSEDLWRMCQIIEEKNKDREKEFLRNVTFGKKQKK